MKGDTLARENLPYLLEQLKEAEKDISDSRADDYRKFIETLELLRERTDNAYALEASGRQQRTSGQELIALANTYADLEQQLKNSKYISSALSKEDAALLKDTITTDKKTIDDVRRSVSSASDIFVLGEAISRKRLGREQDPLAAFISGFGRSGAENALSALGLDLDAASRMTNSGSEAFSEMADSFGRLLSRFAPDSDNPITGADSMDANVLHQLLTDLGDKAKTYLDGKMLAITGTARARVDIADRLMKFAEQQLQGLEEARELQDRADMRDFRAETLELERNAAGGAEKLFGQRIEKLDAIAEKYPIGSTLRDLAETASLALDSLGSTIGKGGMERSDGFRENAPSSTDINDIASDLKSLALFDTVFRWFGSEKSAEALNNIPDKKLHQIVNTVEAMIMTNGVFDAEVSRLTANPDALTDFIQSNGERRMVDRIWTSIKDRYSEGDPIIKDSLKALSELAETAKEAETAPGGPTAQ